MPFLGKDWRSSGEQWVKTSQGWERSKVLECILYNLNISLQKESSNNHMCIDEDEVADDDEEKVVERNKTSTDDENSLYAAAAAELAGLLVTEDEDSVETKKKKKKNKKSLILNHNETANQRIRQPHIIFLELKSNSMSSNYSSNRQNNAPKASISEVLNALDMAGAVQDLKRFNYVCRLVQICINEKLTQLSGNAQRTIFLIVKHLLMQVIRTQENLGVMRKLLIDLKKKIQDEVYLYHFHYIGSQKLCERHLKTIAKWQEMLENPNSHRRVKRLANNTNTSMTNTSIESISFDCKLEIMRRLNNGLDLVNLSQCSKGFNNIISKELAIWKQLCQFHYQQQHIKQLLASTTTSKQKDNSVEETSKSTATTASTENGDLDWKLIYFKLKKRFGHREIYVDMVHKCLQCKCLFWKEIGHPCAIKSHQHDHHLHLNQSDSFNILEVKTEPITPKKLIDLLLK